MSMMITEWASEVLAEAAAEYGKATPSTIAVVCEEWRDTDFIDPAIVNQVRSMAIGMLNQWEHRYCCRMS